MSEKHHEWLKQANYDMDTADAMFISGRYLYAVFMCHLSIEKALKGLYYEKLRKIPPKSHNLVYLLNKMEIKPPEAPGKYLVKLSEASIPTRYPENLFKLQQMYDEKVVQDILTQGKECLKWIKEQL